MITILEDDHDDDYNGGDDYNKDDVDNGYVDDDFPALTVSNLRALQFLNITCLLGGFSSSLGTMSIRKSNWSNLVIAMAMSLRCKPT